MAYDWLEIGATPAEEFCEQLGPGYRPFVARAECQAYIEQLVRMFGEPPEGADLRVKRNAHDFGTYLEVAVKYDPESEPASHYAYRLESEAPANWDTEALAALGRQTA